MVKDPERAKELETASVEAAQAGIKALLLLNGGACIAVLAFMSNVMSKDLRWPDRQIVEAAVRSLTYFASGAGMAVFITLLAYLSNQRYATGARDGSQKHWEWGKRFGLAAIIAALVCLGLFGYGVWEIATSRQ